MSRKEKRNEMESELIASNARLRISFGFALLLVLLSLLVCRLFYIQILCHDEFSEAVRSQYEIRLTGLETETDGGNAATYAVIAQDKKDAELNELLRACRAKNITKASSKYEVYEISNAESELIEKLKTMYDAFVFRNYMPSASVMTVTGEEVRSEMILYADAAGNIMRGMSPQLRVFS